MFGKKLEWAAPNHQVPHVGTRDMGYQRAEKFFFWCPWPVWYTKAGRATYVSRGLYRTRQSAQKALDRYLAQRKTEVSPS